jgi:hypothetical protein
MTLATSFALLPVLFVLVMTLLDLRPWWQQFKQIRSLPELHTHVPQASIPD